MGKMAGFVMCALGGAGGDGGQRTCGRRELLRVGAWAAAGVAMPAMLHADAALAESEEEWFKNLPRDSYYVLALGGTERAGTSPLDKEYREGKFECMACGAELFVSEAKFDSGTGWPSFYDATSSVIRRPKIQDLVLFGTEVACGKCKGHLGHVFKDGPKPTGLRYCINGVALKFRPS